ncbi:shikimate kinase [Thiomonas sp.]|uniref:shikimate kinase n=1 Tax=Thiomonas sp. TaxID=2047785 RepID=UPI00258F1A9C|nr:shikimate kinase [Thiomonas sp.]
MTSCTRIFLIGLMGAGKTTVGRALAQRVGLRFLDSDHEIERREGCTIATLFAREGEQGFREIEARVIEELTERDGIVLATGGGAVLRESNRKALHGRGVVVYLRASPDELAHRTRNDRSRPLLQTADPRTRLRELFRQRDPLYRETAHFTIDTGRPSAAMLTHLVLTQLELAGVVDPSRAPVQPGSRERPGRD